MKIKIISLLILLLFLSGCTSEYAMIDVPVKFYYVYNQVEFGTESGVIKETVREAKGHRDDYAYLINQYLNGPITYDCISPFPAGTTLKELNWDQNRVQIVLSPEITTISGMDLIIACACLTRTTADIFGVNTVQIRASSGLLNGEEMLTFQTESFRYLDQATPDYRVD